MDEDEKRGGGGGGEGKRGKEETIRGVETRKR